MTESPFNSWFGGQIFVFMQVQLRWQGTTSHYIWPAPSKFRVTLLESDIARGELLLELVSVVGVLVLVPGLPLSKTTLIYKKGVMHSHTHTHNGFVPPREGTCKLPTQRGQVCGPSFTIAYPHSKVNKIYIQSKNEYEVWNSHSNPYHAS